jgi:hypothetical protein
MLTLQMLRIMDKLWKREGLDLQLAPYGCIATGESVGFIEVVLNSATTAAITKESGGGAKAAFKESPVHDWLRRQYVTILNLSVYHRNSQGSAPAQQQLKAQLGESH